MVSERNYFITMPHQPGVHFEYFTEVKSVPSPCGGFWGLSPPNKTPSPQVEIWNTV